MFLSCFHILIFSLVMSFCLIYVHNQNLRCFNILVSPLHYVFILGYINCISMELRTSSRIICVQIPFVV